MTFLLGLWQVLRGSRTKMSLAVVCGLLFAGSGLLPPLLIRRIIQAAKKSLGQKTRGIP